MELIIIQWLLTIVHSFQHAWLPTCGCVIWILLWTNKSCSRSGHPLVSGKQFLACAHFIFAWKLQAFPYKKNLQSPKANAQQFMEASFFVHISQKGLIEGLSLFHSPWGHLWQFCPSLNILMGFTSWKINEGLLRLLYTNFLARKSF